MEEFLKNSKVNQVDGKTFVEVFMAYLLVERSPVKSKGKEVGGDFPIQLKSFHTIRLLVTM